MAAGSNQRIPPAILAADRASLLALKGVSDYSPMNSACTTAVLQELEAMLSAAEEAEIIARRAYEVARERAIAAGQAFHSSLLSTKAQVIAQYGADSSVVHAVGLKKKSERQRPLRRTARAEQ